MWKFLKNLRSSDSALADKPLPGKTVGEDGLRASITDPELNVQFTGARWGEDDNGGGKDQYGYRWGGGVQQTVGGFARMADLRLAPFMGERYDHSILELSPGGGRFTAELIRYARSIDLLDMNQACLDVCKERFRYFPLEIGLFANDGKSCSAVAERRYSFIACYDSMVHMHPDIIRSYVLQLSELLESGGTLWLDHSGKGAKESGHRTDMTDEMMKQYGVEAGLTLLKQTFRNDHDCISVFSKSKDSVSN
jgi:hypothetical protein